MEISSSRSNKSTLCSNTLSPSLENTKEDSHHNEENSKIPPKQLSGVIFCLTLRKILYSRWSPYMNFSFALLRGLYKDSIRPAKIIKCKSKPEIKVVSKTNPNCDNNYTENTARNFSSKELSSRIGISTFKRKKNNIKLHGISALRKPMHKILQIFKQNLEKSFLQFRNNSKYY